MGGRQRCRHRRPGPHATGGRRAGHHAGLTLRTLLLGVAAYVVVTVAVTVIALRIVLTLPPDYFVSETPPPPGRGLAAVATRVGRNLLGLLLIVAGIGLSVPGVPGQGFLTIVVGLLLVDFPGRRRVERALLARPSVLSALNRVRSRFGRPPLEAPRP